MSILLIETIKSTTYTTKEVVQTTKELDFGKTLALHSKGMQNNDISKVMNVERPATSPAVCSLLQHFQPRTAFVARNFSMLQKLLAKFRNFTRKVKNVKQNIILPFTFCIW